MAQTTSALSFVAAYVETNTTGTVWVAVGGFAASVAVSGGDRQVGESFTFDGDTPIITAGKRGSIDVTVRYLYTEGATDPFLDVLDSYDDAGGGLCNVRWAPRGNSAGYYQFTTDTDNTELVSFGYPQGEAGPGDSVMCEFTVKTGSLTAGTIAA
jgi:hypothetical protein